MTRKSVSRFLVLALCIYGALTLAWPGFGDFYAQCFRGALRGTLGGWNQFREIEIPNAQPAAAVTRIVLVNRNLIANDGSGPVRNLDLPNATFWNGTALFLALSLATPRRWPSRVSSTAGGALVVQIFVAATVSYALWNEGRHVGLNCLTAGWVGLTDQVQITLVERASLVVPVLVWLLGFWRLGQGRDANSAA